MIFGVIIAIVFIVLISNFLKTKIAYGQIIKIDKVQNFLEILDLNQKVLNINYNPPLSDLNEGSYVKFKYSDLNDNLVLKDIKVIVYQEYDVQVVTNFGNDGASNEVLKNLGLSKLNELVKPLLIFVNIIVFAGIFFKKKYK